MRTTMRRAFFPLLLSLVAACSDDPEHDAVASAAELRPDAVFDGLLYGAGADGVLTIDLADPLKVARHTLPTPLAASEPRAGGEQVVVLTQGREAIKQGDERLPALSSELLLFDRSGPISPAPHRLSQRFGGLVLSADGHFAIAYQPLGDFALENAVEVIDLRKVVERAADASTLVPFQYSGIAPTRFVFGPTTGFMRRLVVVPLTDTIELLDLENPKAGVTSISLRKSETDPRRYVAGEVLFSGPVSGAPGDRIFVQTMASSELYDIRLIGRDLAQNPHGFEPIRSLLQGSGQIDDIAMVGASEVQRLLAAGDRLEVFDLARGDARSIQETGAYDRLLPFVGESPADKSQRSRVLLYTQGQSRIGFVDLNEDSQWSTRSIETLELGQPVRELVALPAQKLALAVHDASKLSVIDLQRRTVGPLRLTAPLTSWLVDEQATRLWLLAGNSLAVTELATLTTRELPLSVSPLRAADGEEEIDNRRPTSQGQLVLIPSATRRRVAVLHSAEAGRITLLDADQPTAQESWLELAGFFLAGLLD